MIYSDYFFKCNSDATHLPYNMYNKEVYKNKDLSWKIENHSFLNLNQELCLMP